MVELTRTVRFSVNPDSLSSKPQPPSNTFAAYPSMRGLGRHYELDIRCRGDADPTTGYFLNIKEIDEAARAAAVPLIEHACRERPHAEPAQVLGDLVPRLNAALGGRLASVRWRLSPYYSVEMAASTPTAEHTGQRALIRQQFEFAASHRLHVPAWTPEQNRAAFGKCNSASGHGHNYRVEPCVEVSLAAKAGPPFTLADLERLTHQTIIARFDHKHLNDDTAEFGPRGGGGNPSVENIARVCYGLLAPQVAATAPGTAQLRSLTVWETDKTSCTYPA